MSKPWHKIKKFLKVAGPGIVTGAADDDPSGIATYSQTGAQFGYGQLWSMAWLFPLMVAVQEACARIGAVNGKGLSAVIKKYYSKKVLFFVVGLVFVANTINIGADIGAMAEAAKLIVPVNFSILMLFFTASILLLEIFVSYRSYSKILKWFIISLLAYPVSLFLVTQPWSEIYSQYSIHLRFLFCDYRCFGDDDFALHVFLGGLAGSGRRTGASFDSQRWPAARFEKLFEGFARG